MGLAPKLIQQIFTIITEINEQGTTVLLVEQNAAQGAQAPNDAHILETARSSARQGRGPRRRPGGQGRLLGGDV